MRSRLLIGAIFLIITASVFAAFWPTYQTRRTFEQNNKIISIAVDYEDVLSASGDLRQLKEIPVAVVALSDEATLDDERNVRAAGFRVLWQIKTSDYLQLQAVLKRFHAGDGVMSTEKHAPGFPMYLKQVTEAVVANKGFLPLFEFFPQKGLPSLASQLESARVKAHLIGDREVFVPQVALWKRRLDRAAKERGVRFFYLRMTPSMTWEKNIDFLKSVAESFLSNGFQLGDPRPYENWGKRSSRGTRSCMIFALFLAVAAPVLGFWLFGLSKPGAPYGRFLLVSLLSAWGGVVVYLTGSSVSLVLGISAISGVKFQLVAPLLFATCFLLDPREGKKWLETPIKVKHIILVGGVVGAVGILYLMRSGNFPLIPVSNSERHLRDALETWLGARPRFKEFFIGHPALITAFYLQSLGRPSRVLLLIGLIGQISVVNTFLHFHIPLELGLLRTFHGLWIGSLLALPWCWAARRLGEEKQ